MAHDSERLFAEACRVIPGGVNSPVRAWAAVGGTPLFLQRAYRIVRFLERSSAGKDPIVEADDSHVVELEPLGAMRGREHELGFVVAGGKGRTSRQTPNELTAAGMWMGLARIQLCRAPRFQVRLCGN